MSKGTYIPKAVRKEKMAAYPQCAFCHTTKDLECAHFNPKLPATFENIIVCCSHCHMLYMHDEEVVHRHADMVRQGIKEAKERGVHFGKKPIDYEKVMRLISEKSTQFNDDSLVTEREIAEEAGVKYTTYAKCKRKLFAAMEQETWPYDWPKPTFRRNYPLYEYCIKELRGAL